MGALPFTGAGGRGGDPMKRFEGNPGEFTPFRPEHRDLCAHDLASAADDMPDPELAAYIAHGAPAYRVSAERLQRLCQSFVDMLRRDRRGAPARDPSEARDITAAVLERWCEGGTAPQAYAAVAGDRGMNEDQVRDLWLKWFKPFPETPTPDQRRSYAPAWKSR